MRNGQVGRGTSAWKRVLFSAAVAGVVGITPGFAAGEADLVLRGGKVATVNDSGDMATAVAVRGHEIIAVGSDEEIESYMGDATEAIDLGGRLLIPGFIEGHGHFMGLGMAKLRLDLTKAKTWDDIVAMVAEAAKEAEPGEWLLGRGWHQEKWSETPEPNVDGVPLNDSLSAVSPDNPVLLTHASGHAAFANDRALEVAGVTKDTPDPEGGIFVRDADGDATGLLRETAQRAVGRALDEALSARAAEQIEAEAREAVELAGEDALSKGVTSFQDAGSSFATIDFFKTLAAKGALPIRLYVMVRRASNQEMEARLPDYLIIPEGNDFLSVRSIKRQIDGALGAHGAWLLEPYVDLQESTGLVLESVEDISHTAEIAIKYGFQVNTHAIGDRANREVLDLYEHTFKIHPEKKDLRWRVEHAQHLHADDVKRFAPLGVIASMQGIHCTSDAPWIPKRLGVERGNATAYLFRTLIDSGAVVSNGTDAPVEDIDPIPSFYASAVRRTADGSEFTPEQRMTREEALRSYTINAAYAAFEEHLKGSIEVGKLADLVVLSKDILTVPDEEILDARVDLTILGGKVRYRRD